VLPAAGDNVELFWSSTRGGGWSVHRSVLDMGTSIWGAVEQVTVGPGSERAPLAVDTGAGTVLAYRSNESLVHASTVYGATKTLDVRYAGTTTVDTRAAGKLALRGTYDDFQTYTYDTGTNGVRTDADRVSRDTIGIYLAPQPGDTQVLIDTNVARLRSVLAEFMPVSSRAVLITP
jgi:hypothetical protein